jgi:hypothetical protein
MRLVHAFQILELISFLFLLQSYPAVASQRVVLDPMKWVQETGGPHWGYGYIGDNAKTGAYLGAFTPIQPTFSPAGIVIGLPPLPENLPPGASPYAENAVGFSVNGASIDVILNATSTDKLYCHSGAAGGTIPDLEVPVVPIEFTTLPYGTSEVVCWNLGKSYIYITIMYFSITYYPDLWVSPLKLSQSGSVLDLSHGQPQVKPGIPIQVQVPVGGVIGLYGSMNYTTSVVLQAGSQPPQTRTIHIEDIPATGNLLVPFEVTFNENETGMQTISATVSPNNTLNESYLLDNTSSVQVNVGGKAQLDVSLPETPSDQWQVDGDTITVTTPPSNPGNPLTHELVINCIDPITKQHLNNCTYRISMEVTKDGGHHAKDHTGDRPQITLDPDWALNTSNEIYDTSGDSITVTLPEVSGETTLTIDGTGPSGEPLASKKVVFDVKIKNLFDLRLLGINFHDITHHPDDGFWGNYFFMISLQVLLGEYKAAVMSATGHAPQALQSQAGSLSWGGLFDYPGLWKKPHSRHRDGSDIDFDFPVNQLERKKLAQTVYDSLNLSFNPAESPNPPPNSKPVTHWHVWIRK